MNIVIIATLVLQSVFSSGVAEEAAGSCNLSNQWCTTSAAHSSQYALNSAKWGSFRPGSYFGMKQKSVGPVLGTGIMWSSSLTQGNELRDQTAQDQLARFEWLKHDGRNFGIESLVDPAYAMDIEASFVIPDALQSAYNSSSMAHVPDWFQKILLKPTASREPNTNPEAESKKSLMFYFGTECVDGNTAACLAQAKVFGWKVTNHIGSLDRGFDSAVSVVGHTESTGWFCLFLIVQQQHGDNSTDSHTRAQEPPAVSYTGMGGVSLLQGADRLKNEAKLVGIGSNEQSNAGTRRGRKQLRATIFDDFGELNNESEDATSFVAVQVAYTGTARVDALLYTHLAVGSNDELAGFIGQAESTGAENVLPFWMCTMLTVSSRALARASPVPVVPPGTTPAPSSALVDNAGIILDDKVTDEGIRTDHALPGVDGEVIPVLTDEAGPLVPVHCANRGQCIRDEADLLLQKYSFAFDEHFAAVFPFDTAVVGGAEEVVEEVVEVGGDAAPVFTQNDIEAAKICLSSVLGGMGYFQGRPSIGAAADVDLENAERGLSEAAKAKQLVEGFNEHALPLSLFTATPSRTSFPRGFLWDEGFHQLLISQWDPLLSMEVVSSWMRAMHFPCQVHDSATAHSDSCVGGWIPREMILGEEARRRVPEEFVVQRVNIANPPTFLLVVDNLLTRFESSAPPQRRGAAASTVKAPAQADSMLIAKTGEVAVTSEELKPDEEHGDKEVMKRYRKSIDPRDAQLVLVQHSADRDTVLTFLRDMYPQLHRWVQWFMHSQKGSSAYPGSFRWRGRSQTDGKVIPNTLASGLDDYPRSPLPTAEEHHVDLHCWMTKATAVMARLERVLRDTGYALNPASEALALMAQYQTQHEYLLQQLDELHWSPQHQGFFDVGLNNEDGFFTQELIFRCSNPQDHTTRDVTVPVEVVRSRKQDFCPPSHPKALFPIGDGQGNYKIIERLVMDNAKLSHIPRVGYVAIFPLLLRLLDPYSPKLGAVLDMIEDPQKLWTEHGLRSIALTDKFYQRRNSPGDAPYWRGPIWIPVNYLALGALHHYAGLEGVYQARAQRLYTRLRNNVLQTVLGQYASTGQFWEQYEDSTGAGMRGHPFTGWTALVVNIMAENF